jgi:hypothetical protein
LLLPRFLVDECLSTSLPHTAHQLGFECTHINHLGLVSIKDWDLVDTIVDGNWTLVTNNAIEWRGRYRSTETLLIHPVSCSSFRMCGDWNGNDFSPWP